MSFLASSSLGPLLFPSDRVLHLVPALVNPITSIAHAATTAYLPMLGRIFVQAALEPKVGYDNADPRRQIARLAGKSVVFDRLQAAHLNLLESMPFFCSAILAGVATGIDRERLSKLATLWLVLRNAYTLIYLFNNRVTSAIRSVIYMWSLAISCNLLREAAQRYWDSTQEPSSQ